VKIVSNKEINIRVPVLARVEGEGALELDISHGKIDNLKLNIFEPPRLFEKFLEGRHFTEVSDIVARICGICPVAYQMSAVHAFEDLFEVNPGPWVRDMRRLFYCGEWIESHALHIHLLAAPDFLGYESAPAMAKDYPKEVRRGIELQNVGNEIVKLLGGRSVHPVGVKVGGFYHAPSASEVSELLAKLKRLLPSVEELLPWTASLNLPQDEQDFTSVALRHSSEYPMNEGRIDSSDGLNLGVKSFSQHFAEHHEPHSTALHCLLDGKPYLVGPLARVNLNFDRLPMDIKVAALATGIKFPSNNMFNSIVARAIEILFAFHQSIEILDKYTQPQKPFVDVKAKAGIAYGCTEAPRGILWHRYEVDNDGVITQARIVPPTSQNQARMEEDLKNSLTNFGLDNAEEKIQFRAEQLIRNYDPCISCATHFLDLRIIR